MLEGLLAATVFKCFVVRCGHEASIPSALTGRPPALSVLSQGVIGATHGQVPGRNTILNIYKSFII